MSAPGGIDADVEADLESKLRGLEREWRAADRELGLLRLVSQIRHAPPPLVDMLRRGEIAVAAFASLRPQRWPPRGWPGSLSSGASSADERLRFAVRRGYDASTWFSNAGGARIGIGLRGDWLDMSLALASHVRLETRGARGSLRMERSLPETVLAALVGQQVDRLVAHALLFGSGMVVTGYKVRAAGGVSLSLDVGCTEVDLSSESDLFTPDATLGHCRRWMNHSTGYDPRSVASRYAGGDV